MAHNQMWLMGFAFDVLTVTSAPLLGMVVYFRSLIWPSKTWQKWMILMYWWAWNYRVTDATCAVHQWLREVCSARLLQTPIKLGGSVANRWQLDERIKQWDFGVQRDLYTMCLQYHHGQWVFGLADTSQQPALRQEGCNIVATHHSAAHTNWHNNLVRSVGIL